MRRYIKKQLLEIVSSIEEANTLLVKLFEKNEIEAAMSILAQEQEAAIRIGDEIERSEGIGAEEGQEGGGAEGYEKAEGVSSDSEKGEDRSSRVINMLEDYCELLWQCSEETDRSKRLKICSRLRKSCYQIQKSIRSDISEQYEAVFLPYKASMWDSLESIWLAAREDKDCDAYVIPIPYYDKNPDGSFAAFHYEGAQFPEYVPITDYQTYDLQKRHPDMIYFHNPYDQDNLVTSVPSSYYSPELKKCTDMLVYVPYFVSVDDVDEHLCKAIGIFHADRVVVQSEQVKKTYVRVFTEMVGAEQRVREEKTGKRDQRYWDKIKKIADQKFLALGSPKFDKVLATTRENVEIPEAWERILYKEDGTRKKVVFYNTTLAALLESSQDMIDKINSSLTIFHANKEIALLWRPHPLTETTLRTMRPQLVSQYRQIVRQYKEEGWGIFDDTADVNRAIALSDAYFGDWSSVVALYRVTGKPILIQNVEVQ